MTSPRLCRNAVSMPKVYRTVRRVVLDLTELESNQVTRSSHFKNTLGIDGPIYDKIVSVLEEHFSITISSDQIAPLMTCESIAQQIWDTLELQRGESLLEIFAHCYREVTGVTDIDISLSTHLQLDLKLDSLTRLEISERLRESYDLQVCDDMLCHHATVTHVVSYLKQLVRDA